MRAAIMSEWMLGLALGRSNASDAVGVAGVRTPGPHVGDPGMRTRGPAPAAAAAQQNAAPPRPHSGNASPPSFDSQKPGPHLERGPYREEPGGETSTVRTVHSRRGPSPLW